MENQDVVMSVENNRFVTIALADGVSTCSEAKEGALITCSAITHLFSKKGDYFIECDNDRISDFVVSHIMYELNRVASDSGKDVEDYSSTIASVVVDKKKKKMLFFSLGDSMIFTTKEGKCNILSVPSDSTNGCPVTTTNNAKKMVSCGVVDIKTIDSVTLCSDGAWSSFFKRNTLKNEIKEMLVEHRYDELEAFLDGEHISDDYSFISMQTKTKNRRRIA